MQIPRFPLILKMQKQIWVFCWVGISVLCNKRCLLDKNYKKRLNYLTCAIRKGQSTQEIITQTLQSLVFLLVNYDPKMLIIRFYS